MDGMEAGQGLAEPAGGEAEAGPAAAGAGAGGVADGAQRDPAEQAVLLEAYRALAREAFPDLPDLAFSGGDFATLQRDLALARAAWQQGKQAAVRDVPVWGGSAARLVDRGEGLRGEERIRHALSRGAG